MHDKKSVCVYKYKDLNSQKIFILAKHKHTHLHP